MRRDIRKPAEGEYTVSSPESAVCGAVCLLLRCVLEEGIVRERGTEGVSCRRGGGVLVKYPIRSGARGEYHL